MACASFDGQVVRQDEEIAELAKRFVCVRMQSMNGVNINLFQFERDLTWMAFFMDGQDRFYARYGGREDANAESHLTKESLVRTMKQVLELHRKGEVQRSRYEPGVEPARRPEDILTMRAIMEKRQQNQCIHCHDVKVAELRHLQEMGTFRREMVFTYPAASSVGIHLDPDIQNKVRSVTAGSPAERAGIKAGDLLESADGQRILTFADFNRVLELTRPESVLPVKFKRGNESKSAELKLSGLWRRTDDPSWRESLHVAGPNGGFWGHKLDEDDRKEYGISEGRMAVLINFIWGDHTQKAGIKNNDVVVKFDGMTGDMTIPQLHAHLNLNRDYGDRVPLTVRRGGKDVELTLALPTEAPKD